MKLVSISSQVVWGPVGNTAAVPALQAKGHEVLALPTITLSNHPGHGAPAGFRTQAEDMARMFAALEALGALSNLDAMLTGYFASVGQVEEVARLLDRVAVPYLLVDPVMGDHGRLYIPQEVAAAIRAHLVPRATCLTPNAFELAWLSGLEVADEDSAIAAARALGRAEVLATSIPAVGDRLATLLVTPDAVHRVVTPKLAGVPHGTGDFLSGLYLAERLSLPPQAALAAAMKTLARAIALSAGTTVLNVAGALHHVNEPSMQEVSGSSSAMPADAATRYIGLDGCRGGWLAVYWDGSPTSSPNVRILANIHDLDLPQGCTCAIDIPIGFMDTVNEGGRDAERAARNFLKGKTSSVFSAPCRKALGAKSFAEALALNKQNSQPRGIGLSQQSAALIPKLKEVDDFITVEVQEQLFESHPEVAFAIMNGNSAVLSKKRQKEGASERIELLRKSGFPIDNLVKPERAGGNWFIDDLLDACACAWSARRIHEGRAVTFPADPPRDARGLRMAISA